MLEAIPNTGRRASPTGSRTPRNPARGSGRHERQRQGRGVGRAAGPGYPLVPRARLRLQPPARAPHALPPSPANLGRSPGPTARNVGFSDSLPGGLKTARPSRPSPGREDSDRKADPSPPGQMDARRPISRPARPRRGSRLGFRAAVRPTRTESSRAAPRACQ